MSVSTNSDRGWRRRHRGSDRADYRRLRKIAGVPTSVHHSYLPYGEFPSLDREPLVEGSLDRTLEQVYDVGHAAPTSGSRQQRHPKSSRDSWAWGSVRRSMQTGRITMDERKVRIEFARSWARLELELTVHLER
jgi:DNA-binding GntR family transcriptional regulator